VIKKSKEQRGQVPLSEVPALGRHVVGAYYQALKDCKVVGYGEESKAIAMVVKRFGIPREQVWIRDNEGHPSMYISAEANMQVERQLRERDSYGRENYQDVVPAGMWQPPLRW